MGLALAAIVAAAAPAQAFEREREPIADLPWSALPTRTDTGPLQLTVARIPVLSDADPSFGEALAEPSYALGTTVWAGDGGALLVGVALAEARESDHEPQDRLFGDLRKRYTAIFAFDQPLGFSTALIVDVLSKDKRRGQKEFKIFQIAVSRSVAEQGSLTAGSAILLNGLNPELNLGLRLLLPLGGL